jgi:rod shape-determining protein MreD
MYFMLVLAFFLQATLIDMIKIANARPDLGSMLVIFVAIFFGWETGLEAGFVFGFLKDIYSVDIFGINTAALAVTGFVAGILSPKVFRESRIIQLFIVFILTLFCFIVHYILTSAISSITYINFTEYLFPSFIPISLYTALISFFVFPFLIDKLQLKENAEYL